MTSVKLASGLAIALTFILAVVTVPAFSAVAVGDQAPDFQLGSVTDNSVVKLSDYLTKPTLVVFWASWCSHCQSEAPVVTRIYNDLRPKGMNVVGVSADDQINDARDFVKAYSVPYTNAFAGTDSGHAVIESYQVQGVPTLFVLDKGGIVKARFVGATDEETIKKEFEKLGVK